MGYLDKDGLQHYHTALQPSLVRSVTQAEYDLLTEEQKKGLFVITDAQSGSGGEAGDTGADSCGEVYSTEETHIGTWIDGKPLYRKVSIGNFAGSASVWNDIDTIPDVDTVASMIGVCVIDIAKCALPDRLSAIWLRRGAVSVLAYDSTYAQKPVTVITEYTKTTDEAVSG